MKNIVERNVKSMLCSDFEKALLRACYSEDNNLVKDKHIETVIEYISNCAA